MPDPAKLGVEPGYPPPSVRALLAAEGDLPCELLTVGALLLGGLTAGNFTVLCVPGGFAPNTAAALGAAGQQIIRDFVAGGGGYVGLCAGAYLGSSACLSLLPVRVLDIDRWARGSGSVQIYFSDGGARLLGSLGSGSLVSVRYANGPLLQVTGAGAEALAFYATEFSAIGDVSDFPPIMAGSPAVVIGRCGRGLVALVSPHIEDGGDERTRSERRGDTGSNIDGGRIPSPLASSTAFTLLLPPSTPPPLHGRAHRSLDDLRAAVPRSTAPQPLPALQQRLGLPSVVRGGGQPGYAVAGDLSRPRHPRRVWSHPELDGIPRRHNVERRSCRQRQRVLVGGDDDSIGAARRVERPTLGGCASTGPVRWSMEVWNAGRARARAA